jgi:putative flippase GtrA
MKHWTEVLMEKLRNPKSVKNFAVYLSIACTGVAANIISATLLRREFGFGFGSSIVAGYLVGMVLGFVLTKLFAFNARNSGNVTREAIKFFMVSMVALTVTWLSSEMLLRISKAWFEFYPSSQYHLEGLVRDISQMLSDISGFQVSLAFIDRFLFANIGGIGFGFFANFFGHKYFTFKTTGYYDRMVEKKKAVLRK